MLIVTMLPGKLTALVTALSLACCAIAQGQQRPNIVIILTDDMGFSDLGCFGSEIETPNLDKLAAGGVRFTQFYNTARCCPTRASLLTGQYPHKAGMGHMTHTTSHPGYSGDLSYDTPTIAEVLHRANYATYMAGKWHVTSNDMPDKPKDNWPRQRGFDRYYGTIKGGGSYYDPAMLTRDNTPISAAGDPEYHSDHYYYTEAIADQASRFIREHHERAGDKPFFLYVAFTAAHWPLHAPENAVAKYKGKYDAGYEAIRARRFEKMKSLGLTDPSWELSKAPMPWEKQQHKEWEARCMEVYAAQVDCMDQGVGKIVDALKGAHESENTLILFLQDNGGCAEDQGRREKVVQLAPRDLKPDDPQPDVRPRATRDGRPLRFGFDTLPGPADTYLSYGKQWANVSNTPFKEYKHFVHEGGISTPLIAYWPAGIASQGRIETQPGHLIDLMATCVDLAGAKIDEPSKLPGVSLAPALRAAGVSLNRNVPIFFEHEGNRAVRDGKWKLVATGPTGAWELYDMQADRTEMHDLAADQPDRVKRMSDAWDKWARENNVLPLMAYRNQPATKPAN